LSLRKIARIGLLLGKDMREVFDELDRRPSRLLSENEGALVNELATRLQISPLSVRARLTSELPFVTSVSIVDRALRHHRPGAHPK